MHLACRYEGSHNAVKLVQPRLAWHYLYQPGPGRSFSTTKCRPQIPRPYDSEHRLGGYTPQATANPQARNIAVLGAGISGLATAFNLSKEIPHAKITVFEEKERVGGWIDSEQVEVNDGHVLFEWGPRSLRPDPGGSGRATLRLLSELKAKPRMAFVVVGHDHSAAKNRYVYYPDRLVCMPAWDRSAGLISNAFRLTRSLLTEPIFSGVLKNIVFEPTRAVRSLNLRDESIGSFVSRRYGSALTDNLVSALLHGIYAGDLYKLSARTLLRQLWHLEGRDRDDPSGILLEVLELRFRQQLLRPFEVVRFLNRLTPPDPMLLAQASNASVYSFPEGIGYLSDVIVANLADNPNVAIATSSKLNQMSYDQASQKFTFSVADAAKPVEDNGFDYVVSSLSPKSLRALLPEASDGPKSSLPSKLAKHSPTSVNVMVVNLYYKDPNLPVPPGFGYLIPRSVPYDQNPERALGVIFSSQTAGNRGPDAFQDVPKPNSAILEKIQALIKENAPEDEIDRTVREAQDKAETIRMQVGQDTATGTKLAVMLGGHWWDGWTESDLPSESEGINMAKLVIARHLGITDEPLVAKARLQRDCIPQYQVGYRDDMAQIHTGLMQAFSGRLKVTGPWWQGGVGVNDCVKSAYETTWRIREGWDHETGLEDYGTDEKWVLQDMRTGAQVMDPLQQ